jgi:hypothetical protein
VKSKVRHESLARSALACAALLAISCSTVNELPPAETPAAHGGASRRYRIECIELAQCKEKASVACGTPFAIVSEWHNTIAESDLPGLNEGSRPKDYRDWNRYRLPDRTGIESDEPMPLASIVVRCNG